MLTRGHEANAKIQVGNQPLQGSHAGPWKFVTLAFAAYAALSLISGHAIADSHDTSPEPIIESHDQHRRTIGRVIGISNTGSLIFEGVQDNVLLWGVTNADLNALNDLVGTELACRMFALTEEPSTIRSACEFLDRENAPRHPDYGSEISIQHYFVIMKYAEENCEETNNAFGTCE